jgi:hypothetical protein
MNFEWDENKNGTNIEKHGLTFHDAQFAFSDDKRLILEDRDHSQDEQRYFCIGKTNGEIATVRSTFRGRIIRIFVAGYWRKGKKIYEKENKIH